MRDPAALQWFAVYAALRCEFQARAALTEAGYEAYCPAETKWAHHGRKKTAVQRPYFARYLFVGIDYPAQGFDLIRTARGVERLVGTTRGPIPIPYRWIDKLRTKETLRQFDETYTPELVWAKGDAVEVVGGAYDGFVGEVTRARGKRRVELLIRELGSLGQGVVIDTTSIKVAGLDVVAWPCVNTPHIALAEVRALCAVRSSRWKDAPSNRTGL
jgi:transcriptional antiterminator NusG